MYNLLTSCCIGDEEGRLHYPWKVAVMPVSGNYVVYDGTSKKSRMQLFDEKGRFLKRFDTVDRIAPAIVGLAIAPRGRYFKQSMLVRTVHTET